MVPTVCTEIQKLVIAIVHDAPLPMVPQFPLPFNFSVFDRFDTGLLEKELLYEL